MTKKVTFRRYLVDDQCPLVGAASCGMAVPLWMAMASAAGVVGGAVITALSPTKRGRSSSEEAAPQPEPERIVHNVDHDDEEECAGEQAKDGRRRKGLKRGTADERWLARCSKEVVRRDLDAGCGCPKSCCDHLDVATVVEHRKSQAKFDASERRDDCRRFLEHNPSSSRLGFHLHPDNDASRVLCVMAFDILRGYGYGFTYKCIREVKAGIGSDDLTNADQGDEDSLARMVRFRAMTMQMSVQLDHPVQLDDHHVARYRLIITVHHRVTGILRLVARSS